MQPRLALATSGAWRGGSVAPDRSGSGRCRGEAAREFDGGRLHAAASVGGPGARGGAPAGGGWGSVAAAHRDAPRREASKASIPLEAVYYAFLYPLSEANQLVIKEALTRKPEHRRTSSIEKALVVATGAEDITLEILNLACYGGFAYFKAEEHDLETLATVNRTSCRGLRHLTTRVVRRRRHGTAIIPRPHPRTAPPVVAWRL